jgi:hypothetical protein
VDELEKEKVKVAVKYGFGPAIVKYLRGETPEEIDSDARLLLRESRKIKMPDNTWKTKRDYLKKMRQQYDRDLPIATQLEQRGMQEAIDDYINANWSTVVDGVLDAHNRAKQKYLESSKQYDDARSAEVRRWDGSILAGEMAALKQIVESTIKNSGNGMNGKPPAPDAIKQLYIDYVNSGDIHKARAAMEVLREIEIPEKLEGDRIKGNRIAQQAERDLEQLRVSEGMVQAADNQKQALDDLMAMQDELIDTSVTMGLGNPSNDLFAGRGNAIGRAFNQVRWDRENGRVKILSAEDPEVTGVYIKPTSEIAN